MEKEPLTGPSLFETIRIEDGFPVHPEWHRRRMQKAIDEFWPGTPTIDLLSSLPAPGSPVPGTTRCKVVYDREIRNVSYGVYKRRIIRSLKLIVCDPIDYHAKFSDRSMLSALMDRRGSCDDILIVKKGFITDTSISNIIFLENGLWITPATPLLEGTCRARLTDSGMLVPKNIRPEDLSRMQGWKLINAMRYPEETEWMPVGSIYR